MRSQSLKVLGLRALVVLPLVVGLSGCVIAVGEDGGISRWHSDNWESRQQDNREHIDQLQIGFPYAEVRHKMGDPDFKEAFEKDGASYKVLFYLTDRVKPDGITNKDECTPLVFKNEQLIGWGEKAYVQI